MFRSLILPPARFICLAARRAGVVLLFLLAFVFYALGTWGMPPSTEAAGQPAVFDQPSAAPGALLRAFCDGVSEIPTPECEALVSFYNSTDGPAWTNHNGWLQDNTPCAWTGVGCNAGHVTVLSLSNNRLDGPIPADFGNLTSLDTLQLDHNRLDGEVPASFANLSALAFLDIGYNNLQATDPTAAAFLDARDPDWRATQGFIGTISGTVFQTDNVTTIPFINVMVEGDGFSRSACGGPTGTYTITDVPINLDLRISAANGTNWCGGATTYQREYWLDVPYSWDATVRQVTPGIPDLYGIDFTLEPGGSIAGTVTQADGVTPVEGANVWAESFDGFNDNYGATTLGNGTYVIEGLVPGDYRVHARANGYALEMYNGKYRGEAMSGDRVTVTTGATAPNINFSLDPGGTISGTIYGPDGTTPLEHVPVDLYWGGYGTCTGPDGTYTLTNIPLNFPVTFYAGGHAWPGCDTDDHVREWWNDKLDDAEANPITLTTPGENYTANIILADGGSISGHVYEANGTTPIYHVRISANDADDGDYRGETYTAADGSYTLVALPSGNYRVRADFDGRATELYNNVPYYGDHNLATPVTVTAPNDTPNIDFSLALGGSISGVVYAEDGVTPLANVGVDTQPGGWGRCTDGQGRYSMTGLPLDTPILVRAGGSSGCSGGSSYVEEYYNNKPNQQAADGVLLTAGAPSRTDINFTMAPGGSISGHVYAANGVTPLANIPVDVENGGFGRCTQADGSYFISGLPLNTPIKIKAGGPGWPNCPGENYLREWWNNRPDQGSADPITLTLGAEQHVTGRDFTLEPGGSLSGRVTQNDGTTGIPFAYVTVERYTAGGNTDWFGSIQTDDSGYFTVEGLITGEYRARGEKHGFATEFYNNVPYFGDNNLATHIIVTVGANTPNVNFALDPGGSIAGTVYAADGVTPLANVSVDTEPGGFGRCTGPDGSFSMSGLPLNQGIRLYAGGPGWGSCSNTDYVREYYNGRLNNWEADLVTLMPGSEHRTGIDFQLSPGGSVAGTVYAPDGITPLENMRVNLNFDGWGTSLCTWPGGVYYLGGLPLDTDFRISAGGGNNCQGGSSAYAQEFWDNKPDWGSANVLRVTPGEPDRTGVNFTLALAGTISGKVTEADGVTPIEGVWVSNDGWGGGMGATTNALGQYTIYGLAAGSYNVSASKSGYIAEVYQEMTRNTYFENWTDVLVVAGQDTPNINFTLDPGGSISGHVYAADGVTPLANVPVDTDPGGNGRCTGPDGSFTMDGVPLNTTLKVAAGGYSWCNPPTSYAKQWWNLKGDYNSADTLTLTLGANQSRSDIDFRLTPGGRISGTVVGPDGTTPVANMWVQAQVNMQNYGLMDTCTNADGTYIIRGLPLNTTIKVFAGRSVWCPGPQNYIDEWWNDKPDEQSADPITFNTPGQQRTDINFTLALGGTVTGKVTEADGVTPIQGALVNARGFDNGMGFASTESGPDGTYTIAGLPGGDYLIEASKAGFTHEYYLNFTAFSTNTSAATRVPVTAGGNAPNIDFKLDPGGSISGTVFQPDGTTPLGNIPVHAGYNLWSCSDVTGHFKIDGLPFDTPIKVNASGQGEPWCPGGPYLPLWWNNKPDEASADPITLTAGPNANKTDVNFVMQTGGSISGTITNAANGQGLGNTLVVVNGDNFYRDTCTNGDGTFTLTGLPFNTSLTLRSGGDNWCQGGTREFVMEWYDAKRNPNEATPIIIDPGTPDVIGKNIALDAGGVITGTVTASEDGSPVVGVWLCAFPYASPTFDGVAWSCVQTQANGTYEISAVNPVPQRMWIFPDYRARLFYNQSTSFAGADPVTVTAGVTTPGIDFSLPQAAMIRGTIYQEDGVTPFGNGVTISAEGGEYPECAAPDGTYRIFLPLDASYKITAGPGPCDMPGQTFPAQFYDHVLSAAQATPLNVTGNWPQEITGINFHAFPPVLCETQTDIPQAECEALTALYNGTGGSGWTDDSGWLVSFSPGTWFGVTVSGGHVTGLNLPANHLTGPFPSEIGGLPQLTTLNLSGNLLTGPIPAQVGGLTSLTSLNLAKNALTGDIPANLKNLTLLPNGMLFLEYNMLSAVDPALITFLNSKAPGWANTQTVPPTNVQAAPAGSTSIQVTWTPIAYTGDGGAYTVGYSLTTHGPYLPGCTTASKSDTTCTVNGLEPDTPYFLVVNTHTPPHSGQLNDLTSANSAEVTMTSGAAPTLVSPPDDSSTRDTTPTFTWSSLPGATSYRLHVDNNADFSSPLINTTATTTSHTPGTAIAQGLYYWRVQAKVGGVWSPWSAVWKVTIDTSAPGKPTLLAPASGTVDHTGLPTFDWTAVVDAHHYEFQLDTDSAFGSPDLVAQPEPDSFTPAAALPDAIYFWRVRTVDEAGNASGWTAAWTLTIDVVPTPQPVLLSPLNGAFIKDTTPTLSWDTVSGAVEYRLNVDNDPGFGSLAINKVTTATSFTQPTALPQGLYYWHVQAKGGDGEWSEWSAVWTFTVDASAPAKPALLSPPNGSTDHTGVPAFDWSAIADAHHYEFQLDTDSAFGSPDLEDQPVLDSFTPVSAPPDAIYFWRVRAVDAAGNMSGWTAAWTLTIDAVPTPEPVLLAPVDDTIMRDRTPSFSWDAVPGVTRYRLQVDDSADFSSTVINTSLTALTYTAPTDLVDAEYFWRVQARGADGIWGAWSEVWSFTVDTVKPAKPTLTDPVSGAIDTTGQPVFGWTIVGDADHYEIQLDDTSAFTSPYLTEPAAANTFTPATVLPDALYYWRVRAYDVAGNKGGWTAAWQVRVDAIPTPVPVLSLPTNNGFTADTTPALSWNAVTGAKQYRLQVDNNADFLSLNFNVLSTATSYAPETGLLPAQYFWRVQAKGTDGAWSLWSEVWTFTIDTTKPAKPVLTAPANNATITTTNTPLFEWSVVADAVSYQIQIDDQSDFSSINVNATPAANSYTPDSGLANKKYYWRVRSYDAAGNKSGWAGTFAFTLSYNPAPPAVGAGTTESDSPLVQQIGTWTAHDTGSASGGRYLYSSGSPEDALQLSFTGARLDIVYVRHPALGTFVVELDGVPQLLADAVAAESQFRAVISLNVAPGAHTVRVYPMSGTFAIDAFVVDAAPEPPAVTETPVPTILPTGVPTDLPTVLPPDQPTETPVVVVPVVIVPPYVDSFDTGLGWIPSGAWGFDALAGQWFADAAVRGQSSTLSGEADLDLRAALNPELGFWQKAMLTPGDLVALDLSLDGGLTWLPLDQQVGPVTDWAPRMVSLAAYRGFVIRLRFRLDAVGTVPEGMVSVGWWINDLTVVDAPVVLPTEPPVPTDTPVPTVEPTVEPTIEPTVEPTIEPPVVTPEPPVPTDPPAEPTEPPVETPEATPPPADTPVP